LILASDLAYKQAVRQRWVGAKIIFDGDAKCFTVMVYVDFMIWPCGGDLRVDFCAIWGV